MPAPPRVLVLGAHPDDAEYSAGGLAAMMVEAGHVVKFVSVTDGGAGHQFRSPDELRALRRREAQASGAILGITYEVWNNPDGQLLPTLDLRAQILRELRTFAPDLVLTHRPCDYHPDHRAVGQAVQDASYMVTVPLASPETPALRQDPIVAYMTDLFTRPNRLRADLVLDVSNRVESILQMLACHASQMFEWLPYNERREHLLTDEIKRGDPVARLAWLRDWFGQRVGPRADHFRAELIAHYGPEHGPQIQFVEAYEISEYATPLDATARQRLFPFV